LYANVKLRGPVVGPLLGGDAAFKISRNVGNPSLSIPFLFAPQKKNIHTFFFCPWPRGSATGAAPSTTAGVGRSTSSIGRSLSCELLSNLACSFVSRIELERLDIDA
jgi:hypothetical protein